MNAVLNLRTVFTRTDGATRMAGLLGIAGGALIVAGTLMPWFSLFAGLHPYPGTTGLFGRLLLAGGAVASVAGAALLWSGAPLVRRLVGALGVAMLGFAGWLAVGLFDTIRGVQANPMMVARIEPGLFVVLAGAAVVAAALLVRERGAATKR